MRSCMRPEERANSRKSATVRSIPSATQASTSHTKSRKWRRSRCCAGSMSDHSDSHTPVITYAPAKHASTSIAASHSSGLPAERR